MLLGRCRAAHYADLAHQSRSITPKLQSPPEAQSLCIRYEVCVIFYILSSALYFHGVVTIPVGRQGLLDGFEVLRTRTVDADEQVGVGNHLN